MNLAIFDLDHTLINCDSSSEWSNFLYEKGIFSDADMQRHQAFDQDYRKGCLDLDAYLAFVLRPLADLDPELPLGEHTVREYLARCDSTGIEPVTHPDWHPPPNPGDNHAP